MTDIASEITSRLGASQGWDRFEDMGRNAAEDFKRQREEMLAEAALIARPFKTPDGQALLDLLVKRTLFRPLAKPIEGYTMEQQALYAAQREGQNQIVAMILQAIAVDRGDAGLPERGET